MNNRLCKLPESCTNMHAIFYHSSLRQLADAAFLRVFALCNCLVRLMLELGLLMCFPISVTVHQKARRKYSQIR